MTAPSLDDGAAAAGARGAGSGRRRSTGRSRAVLATAGSGSGGASTSDWQAVQAGYANMVRRRWCRGLGSSFAPLAGAAVDAVYTGVCGAGAAVGGDADGTKMAGEGQRTHLGENQLKRVLGENCSPCRPTPMTTWYGPMQWLRHCVRGVSGGFRATSMRFWATASRFSHCAASAADVAPLPRVSTATFGRHVFVLGCECECVGCVSGAAGRGQHPPARWQQTAAAVAMGGTDRSGVRRLRCQKWHAAPM